MLTPRGDFEMGDAGNFINESLGGIGGPSDIKVDEVIVSGKWQADLSIANSFRSERGRVFLAGDAGKKPHSMVCPDTKQCFHKIAHQLTPAGGHGMNSGIQDSYDLAWKLVAVLNGWGGEGLLNSYDEERRAVAVLNTSMVEKAVMDVVIPWTMKAQEVGFENLIADNKEGKQARDTLSEIIMPGRWLHEQTGTAMGYRYTSSLIVIADRSTSEPPTSITEYIPSTWPGARAPHVFLSDGKTSIFDLYGPDFSIVDFTDAGELSKNFVIIGSKRGIPITAVHLPNEGHCRTIWERDVVLVRPDGFVAWRCPPDGAESFNKAGIKEVLLTATGQSSQGTVN